MRKTKPVLKSLNLAKERKEKARILALLEEERLRLVFAAREIAAILWDSSKEPVTAGKVFEAMHEVPGMDAILAQHDKRWLGAVFTKGWVRVGFSMTGSHCRPVSQWIPSEHKDEFKPFKPSKRSEQ